MVSSFTVAFSLCFLVSLVRCFPLRDLYIRDVFRPTIVSPNSSSIWLVGTKQPVIWKTDNIPPDDQITNPAGMIVLGHLGQTGGLNLDLEHPLATNFSYHLGQIDITVPDVPPRNDYIVVIFGDSGNASPAFAITEIATEGPAPQAPLSTPTTASTLVASASASASSSSPNAVAAQTTPIPAAVSGNTNGHAGGAELTSSIAAALSQQWATMTATSSAVTTSISVPTSGGTSTSHAMPSSRGVLGRFFTFSTVCLTLVVLL